MYSHKDIFMVKHASCLACTRLEKQLTNHDTPIEVNTITLGNSRVERSDSMMLAKRINGEWQTLFGISPGFPFLVLKGKYVLVKAIATKVCHGDLQTLIDVATYDWRAYPRFFKAIDRWYDPVTQKKGKFYDLRDAITKHFGMETYWEITTIVRTCVEQKWKPSTPRARQMAIEALMNYLIRKERNLVTH